MNTTTISSNSNLTARDLAIANVKATLRHFAAEAQTPWLRSVASDALASLAVIEAAPPARTLLDGGPDFEDSAEWPVYVDPTPIEVLARDFELPPIAGGAPFEPSPSDWDDYADATDDRDWYREIDAQAAGLPI